MAVEVLTCADEFEAPEENLAADEALLIAVGQGATGGIPVLRLWESARLFIVLGASGHAADDVDGAACRADRVPILRRVSGGGTVLQGPGCLNFALIFPLDGNAALRGIHESYRFFLGPVVKALALPGIEPRGSSDLALGMRKFSGSAQKRTTRAVLHHGTILYDFDLALIARYLREPPRQPDYRSRRSHLDFLCNVPLGCAELRGCLRAAWAEAGRAPTLPPLGPLIAARYANRAWNDRF